MEAKTWNAKLNDWIVDNPDRLTELKEIFPKTTLQDYRNGNVSNIGKVNSYSRAMLYKITGIEVFRPDNYVDPKTITIGQIESGRLPRGSLDIWLGSKGISKREVAESAGVSIASVTGYIESRSSRRRVVTKIERALKQYENIAPKREKDPVRKEPAEEAPMKEDSENTKLTELTKAVGELVEQVGALGGSYEKDHEERRLALDNHLDGLVDQIDYFRQCSQEERDQLVSYLRETGQTTRWGWLVNMFGGIHREKGVPSTFLRDMDVPEKLSPRRKR
tara:strand:- start:465 stop:1295 length:831 start_codon:yes stop_codon:yes gene_type:complete